MYFGENEILAKGYTYTYKNHPYYLSSGIVGRVFCRTCDKCVGQLPPYESRDATIPFSQTLYDAAVDEHTGPCGLVCRGSKVFTAPSLGLHEGANECVRCAPVSCPKCNGYPEDVRYRSETGMCMRYCDRCSGRGMIPGLEAD